MADKRIKASMSKIRSDIAPYVKKHILGRDTIDEQHVNQIASLLLNRYSNVSMSRGIEPGANGKPWLKIAVKTFPIGDEKVYEVTNSSKRKTKRDNSEWIDRIEEYEAMMDD